MVKTVFSAYDGFHGAELWITDGTQGGTYLLKDINPAADSAPNHFVALGTNVVFSANDGLHGGALWVTDGTAAGTSLLVDLNLVGEAGFVPLGVLGDRLVFSGSDGTHGTELFVTDGTAGGTSLLADINPGATGSNPFSPILFGDDLLFIANDGTHGKELWITDGTPGGTSLVKDMNPGSGNGKSYFPGGAVFNGEVFFQARDGTFNYEVWVTDGTTAGTAQFKDIRAGDAGSSPKYFTVLGDKMLFSADDGVHGAELWVSDGTAGGTSLLADIHAGALPSSPNNFTVLGSRMLFTANDGVNGTELWITDGTSGGTSLLKDIRPGLYNGLPAQSAPGHLTVLGDQVIFTAGDGVHGYELWATDGTDAGTVMVKDINPNGGFHSPTQLTRVGSQVMFAADDGVHGTEVWVTDGTTAGTSMVADINPAGPASPIGFTTGDFLPCFRAGTRIRTPGGEVAVERLRPGDLVVSRFAGTAAVAWVGHRRIDARRHPRPRDVNPVRILPGAFGPGAPARDLWLSPDHAVHVDGVLVPVRYLINGRTIVQERAAEVTYFHVELPAHDVILADGLACETFLDTGNRAAFANGGPAVQLHADFAAAQAEAVWASKACAALVRSGERLASVRAGLLAGSARFGHALTDAPGLRITAGAAALAPRIEGGEWCVRLPPGASRLRLRSRRFVPAETQPAASDTRRLGVALTGLRFDGVPVGLDDPRLTSGWAAPEPDWRWTDGDAGLALAGVREVRFHIALTGTYWLPSAQAIAGTAARG